MTRRLFLLPVLCSVLAIAVFAAKSRAPKPVIVCLGDSITAGYGVDPGKSYPDDLQSMLDRRGFNYRVINAGVSGNTTKDVLGRLKDVLSLHPQITVVEIGGNDGLRGIPVDVTRSNLDTIVSTLLASGSKVVLAGITLPPNYGPDYIHAFNETYRLTANKFHVPLLPMLLIHVYNLPGAMQDDGIHPTAKGQELVAQNVLALLTPDLRR